MSETNHSFENSAGENVPLQNSARYGEEQTANVNRLMTRIVGCVLLVFIGFVAIQNRDSLKIPDRNKLWADYWKKELSKPSGLPDFKSPVSTEFSELKFDASVFQPKDFNFNPQSFQPRPESSASESSSASERSRASRPSRSSIESRRRELREKFQKQFE